MKISNVFSLATLFLVALLIDQAKAGDHYYYNPTSDGQDTWYSYTSKPDGWDCDAAISSAVTYADARRMGKFICSTYRFKVWNYKTIFGTTNYHYRCCTTSRRDLLGDEEPMQMVEEGNKAIEVETGNAVVDAGDSANRNLRGDIPADMTPNKERELLKICGFHNCFCWC